jgi:hypothetical protein
MASTPLDNHLAPPLDRPSTHTLPPSNPSCPNAHSSHLFNFPVGNILQDKPDHVLLVYVQNVNGWHFTSLLHHMRLIQVDYFAFVETKLETQHHVLHQQLQHSISRSLDHHRSVFATSPMKFDTYSKPGGVS